MELFDSQVKMGNSGAVVLNAKHSDLEMGNLNAMDMTIFDSEIVLKDVEKNLDVSEKHSRLEVGKIATGKWEMFDSKVRLKEAKSLKLNAKHGSYELGEVGDIQLSTFDSNINLTTVNTSSASSFRHSRLNIDQLNSSLKIKGSFDSNIDVANVSSSFSEVSFDGRHGSLDLSIPANTPYLLDAQLRHGSVNYNEELEELIQHIDKGVNTTILAKFNGANDQSPKVIIQAESTTVDLNK